MKEFKHWCVRQLELSQGIPALEAEPDAEGLYAVLWWRGIPLGNLEIDAARLPMPAAVATRAVLTAMAPAVRGYLEDAERARAGTLESGSWQPDTVRWLATLDAPLDRLNALALGANASAALDVSVVICTRDRPESLARCLDSLAQLSSAPFEILVVDNASRDSGTRDLVARHPGVRYVHEPRPGLDIARNTGVRHSRGQIIAYVDDDIRVHPQWLTAIAQGFNQDSVMAVTGLVLPAEIETESQYIFEKYWSFNRGYAPKVFGPEHYRRTRGSCTPVWLIGAGANMAFRRSAFEQLGGFDERLDAGAAGVAGDSEFWYRILASGASCRYQPAAVVFHHHRREIEALQSQTFHYMRGHVAALLVQNARYGDRGNLRRLFSVLPRYYGGTALRAWLPAQRRRSITLAMELAGCFAGVKYYAQTLGEAADAVPRFPVAAE